jgi:hypothetical protein
VDKWLVKLFVTYAATVIFLPKIGLSPSHGIYFWEIMCLPLVGLIILTSKFNVRFLHFFYLYCFISFLSFWLGWVIYQEPNWVWLLRLLKFSTLVSIVALPFLIRGFKIQHVRLILNSQLFFVVIFGAYVIWHTFLYPISLTLLSGGYSPEYRLIGFTGRIVDVNQQFGFPDFNMKGFISRLSLKEIGPTSVQMGVHLAVCSSIFFSIYLVLKKQKYLWITVVMTVGTCLCYSRSGFLVLVISLIGLCVKKYSYLLLCYLCLIVFSVIIFTETYPKELMSIGVLGKISEQGLTDSIRLNFWGYAFDRLMNEPWIWVIGIGYGNIASGTLEGLMIDTLIQSGIIALCYIILFMFNLWKISRVSHQDISIASISTRFALAVLNGIHAALPGVFVAITVGGNTLFSDFIAPSFFLVFGICLKEKQKVRRLVLDS